MPNLQAGNYVTRVLAIDTTYNSTSTAAGFSVKSAASVANTTNDATVLSSATAKGKTITLAFTSALGNSARDISTWNVIINGQNAVPTAVNVASETVTLTLPSALSNSDNVSVSWPNLRDAKGKTVGGSWQGKAD